MFNSCHVRCRWGKCRSPLQLPSSQFAGTAGINGRLHISRNSVFFRGFLANEVLMIDSTHRVRHLASAASPAAPAALGSLRFLGKAPSTCTGRCAVPHAKMALMSSRHKSDFSCSSPGLAIVDFSLSYVCTAQMNSSSESDSKFNLSARPLIGNKGRTGPSRPGKEGSSSESKDSTTLRLTETRLAEAALAVSLRALRLASEVDVARVDIQDGLGGVCADGIVRRCHYWCSHTCSDQSNKIHIKANGQTFSSTMSEESGCTGYRLPTAGRKGLL